MPSPEPPLWASRVATVCPAAVGSGLGFEQKLSFYSVLLAVGRACAPSAWRTTGSVLLQSEALELRV